MDDFMEDYFLISVVTTVLGVLGYFLMHYMVSFPGKSLQKKFSSLGTPIGKSFYEIQKVVGAPCAISPLCGNQTLRQWQATGYHIALVFDYRDICIEISSIITC